jgi:small GTP-binding protein
MENQENEMQVDKEHIFKIVLIGDTGVGKSCIIHRFIQNTFEENFVSTMGSAYLKKKMHVQKKGDFVLEIWDTAGQEKYRSITKIFYKEASAVIVVFDITRKETFESIVHFWYNELKENTPKETQIILVGNKNDLYEYEEGSVEDRKQFADEKGITYITVSAKTGYNIQSLFETLAQTLAEKFPDVEDDEVKDDAKTSNIHNSSKLDMSIWNKPKPKKGCCS